MQNIFVTDHFMERLKERFSTFYSENELLKNWNKSLGTNELNTYFSQLINSLDMNKSYINNSIYMIYLYEKYGYDSEYQFFEYHEQNILLILSKKRSEKKFKLVTCYAISGGKLVKVKKYKNKPNIKPLEIDNCCKRLGGQQLSTLELKIRTLIQDNKVEVINVDKNILKVCVDDVFYCCSKTKNNGILIETMENYLKQELFDTLKNSKTLVNDYYIGFYGNKKYYFLIKEDKNIHIIKEEELYDNDLSKSLSKEERLKILEFYNIGNFILIEKITNNKKIISCILNDKKYIIFIYNKMRGLDKFFVKKIEMIT